MTTYFNFSQAGSSTRLWRLAVVAGVLLFVCSADMRGESVYQKSDPLWRPANAPRASDVVMRSLRPRVGGSNNDSLAASRAFHVTRHEWTYLSPYMEGGDAATAHRFVREAVADGFLIGGAGAGTINQVLALTDQPAPAICALDIDGNVFVMHHQRDWDTPPGQGSVFNNEFFRVHLLHYTLQLDLGVTSLQRDEAWMSVNQGYDFSPAAIAAFRRYLATHAKPAELRQWGIGDPRQFDVAAYFRELGLPAERPQRWFHRWQADNPIKQLYDAFIVAGVVDFYTRLRAAINDHAGRQVPFSCNNTSLQQWTPAHLAFDWAMSELMFRTANPQHIYERFRAGLGHGKVQVLSTPKPMGAVTDPAAFRDLNRKVIAQGYALGGLTKAPWDLFLQTDDGMGRYFGKAADYADLYGFVRAVAPYLEGFEEAAAFGHGIPDVHDWNSLPLSVEGSADVCAFLRVRPRDPTSPVVIHLVNWGSPDQVVDVRVRADAIARTADNTIARLLRPAVYDQRLHRLAEKHQAALRPVGGLRGPAQHPAYQHLIEARILHTNTTADGWLTFRAVTAAPWSVIVIEEL
jgi:hypothetical protein